MGLETLPRRGYRFIGTVAEAHDQKLETAQGLSAKDFISVSSVFHRAGEVGNSGSGLGFATAILLVPSLALASGPPGEPLPPH